MIYTIYKSTGEITRIVNCPEDLIAYQLNDGELSIEGRYDDDKYYMIADVPTARPLMTTVATWNKLAITANGVDTVTLGTSLPNPTAIKFTVTPDAIGAVADLSETSGTFVITTTIPGYYILTASAYPYQDYTVTITAT